MIVTIKKKKKGKEEKHDCKADNQSIATVVLFWAYMTSTMEAIRCTVFIDVRLFNTDARFMVVAHLCKTIIFFFF